MLLFDDVKQRPKRTYVRFDDLPILMTVYNRMLVEPIYSVNDLAVPLSVYDTINTFVPASLNQYTLSIIKSYINLSSDHLTFIGKFHYREYPDKIPRFLIRSHDEYVTHIAVIGTSINNQLLEFYNDFIYFKPSNNFNNLSIVVVKVR